MLSGDFYKKLKQLNPNLRVWADPNKTDTLAGVYYVDPFKGYTDLMGIDKNYIPEYTIYDNKGYIIKGGWSRVVWLLYRSRLTTRDKVKKVFPSFFERRIMNTAPQIEVDRTQKRLEDLGIPTTMAQSTDIDELIGKADEVRHMTSKGSYELDRKQYI